MTSGISYLAHLHADARRLDMLAEAAAERRANLAVDRRLDRTPSILVELRHTIGTALVSFGHRLQHQPAPADHGAPLGTLRPAR